jgi:HTH-type transcriptional regulator, competence development regulator
MNQNIPNYAKDCQRGFVLQNTKHRSILNAMKNFGETIRDLRVAQDLGLRETAIKVGISPAYLSRIERGKERPPRPEVIKELAKILAADPDVLFRLSSSTDPEVVDYLHDQPEVMNLLRYVKEACFTEDELKSLVQAAESIKANSH